MALVLGLRRPKLKGRMVSKRPVQCRAGSITSGREMLLVGELRFNTVRKSDCGCPQSCSIRE